MPIIRYPSARTCRVEEDPQEDPHVSDVIGRCRCQVTPHLPHCGHADGGQVERVDGLQLHSVLEPGAALIHLLHLDPPAGRCERDGVRVCARVHVGVSVSVCVTQVTFANS